MAVEAAVVGSEVVAVEGGGAASQEGAGAVATRRVGVEVGAEVAAEAREARGVGVEARAAGERQQPRRGDPGAVSSAPGCGRGLAAETWVTFGAALRGRRAVSASGGGAARR